MVRVAYGLLGMGLLLVAFPAPAAAQVVGQNLYDQNCALCHGDSGTGRPPAFPALSGNDRLSDPGRVARTIREGGLNMPPFPALTTDEILALSNFIRTAWGNDYGAVTSDAVAAAVAVAGLPEAESAASIWDGVYTEAQARRGEAAYEGACGFCHGRRLDGAPDDPDMRSTPPLARARFLRVWEGRSIATLFAYARATMPEDNPNSLTERAYLDVIAYMLEVGGIPAGEVELGQDPQSLAQITIRPEP